MALFLSVLEQDSNAIDRLLYAAEWTAWAALRPQLSGAQQFGYDFSSTHGEVPGDFLLEDLGTVYVDSWVIRANLWTLELCGNVNSIISGFLKRGWRGAAGGSLEISSP